jgi:hypothetical protein
MMGSRLVSVDDCAERVVAVVADFDRGSFNRAGVARSVGAWRQVRR